MPDKYLRCTWVKFVLNYNFFVLTPFRQRGQARSTGHTRPLGGSPSTLTLAREPAQNLPGDVFLTQRAKKAMLTSNLWSEVELVTSVEPRTNNRVAIGGIHHAGVVCGPQARGIRARRSG